ncbi:TPA: multiprotein-bridging factor 1 family protein [Streptococcus suis]
MTAADKIKYILDVTGWSQQTLADELNVTQSAVSAWQRGRAVRTGYTERIDKMYDRARRIDWERKRADEVVPTGPQVLSQRGKIIFKYPYYSHQRMPWERR